jgi:hypothetical protein
MKIIKFCVFFISKKKKLGFNKVSLSDNKSYDSVAGKVQDNRHSMGKQ